MAGFYVWAAVTASATLSYGTIAIQMVVYGLGMGLTSAPATESIMGAVSRSQAGVGSAVNDSTRLLGGTLGVAVIGSVYASLYGSRLTTLLPSGLPAQIRDIAHQSLGAAYAVSARVPGAAGRAVHDAATTAFLHGLSAGCLVAGGAAAAGAVLAAFFLPSHPLLPAQPASPAAESARLWPDVVCEAGDTAGDRAAITGLGDAVVERGEDAGVVRHERADAYREHDGDNQRQDAAYDSGDGLAVACHASGPSPVDSNAAEDRREQAARQGERKQHEGHRGHQTGDPENQGGHT
jgi:hypothetical protein